MTRKIDEPAPYDFEDQAVQEASRSAARLALFHTRLYVKRDVEVDVICKQCRRKLGRCMLYQVMQEYPIEITCRECWPAPVTREYWSVLEATA